MQSSDYPNVVCQPAPGSPPTVDDRRDWLILCSRALNDMDVTQATQVFGPRSTPGVAVGLPIVLSHGKCTVLVLMTAFASS